MNFRSDKGQWSFRELFNRISNSQVSGQYIILADVSCSCGLRQQLRYLLNIINLFSLPAALLRSYELDLKYSSTYWYQQH